MEYKRETQNLYEGFLLFLWRKIMKKIIHLTDTHIGAKHASDNMKKLVDKINKETREAPQNYVIVYTGDVIDDAKNHPQDQYHEVISCFDQLKKKFVVLAVPGNHDYGSGVFHENESYAITFNKYFYGKENVDYPKDAIYIDDGIAFIGLNSMAELHPVEGKLGQTQLTELTSLLASKDDIKDFFKVVYLHHSPFKLNDSDELKKILAQHKIDALLFGHTHHYECQNGEWNIPRVYNGGIPTSNNEKKHRFRIIDLSQNPPSSAEVQGIPYR